MQEKKSIAVLGAGPMGLAVAYQLAHDGHRPVLFEADDRIGGMTASFDFDGTTIERYYHFHCTSDRDFLQILDELSLSEKNALERNQDGLLVSRPLASVGHPLALLAFEGLGLLAKFATDCMRFLCTRRKNWQPLDGIDATGWIKRWGRCRSLRGAVEALVRLQIPPVQRQPFSRMDLEQNSPSRSLPFQLMHEKLGYLEGGSDTLLQAMRGDIEANGGELRLGSAVSKVVVQDGRVAGLELHGKIELFDTVISTIPLPNIPRLVPDLPPAILEQYRSLKNIAVVCVIAKLRKPVSEKFWINTNDEEMDIPGLVEYSNLRTLAHHIVYVPFYMPGDHPMYAEPDQAFLDKVRRYLRKINPDLVDDDFIAIRASRYRNAQPICPPNFLASLPPDKSPIEGLWAADTSYYYPEDRGISESIGYGRNLARRVAQYYSVAE